MLSPGDMVADRYRTIRQLGQGGLAEVWLVEHIDLNQPMALKLLTLRKPSLTDRLLQEGRIQARLRHPHVVSVSDVVRHEGGVGLVMEYVEGPTLEQHLLNTGALEVDAALELLVPVLGAVAVAHRMGILHRDLKPANVLLQRTSAGLVPKVADFGIAKVVEGSMRERETRMGAVMGTPGYLAPEQAVDASTVDARADVFALAAITWEMLAGEPAFVGSLEVGRYDAPAPLSSQPELPAHIAAAVTAGLAIDPDARSPSVAAYAEALLAQHPELLRVFHRLHANTGGESAWVAAAAGETLLPDDIGPMATPELGSRAPSTPPPSAPPASHLPLVPILVALGTGGALVFLLFLGLGVPFSAVPEPQLQRQDATTEAAPLVATPRAPEAEGAREIPREPADEPEPSEQDPPTPSAAVQAAPAATAQPVDRRPPPAQAEVDRTEPAVEPAPEPEPTPEATPAPVPAPEEAEVPDDDAVAMVEPDPTPEPQPEYPKIMGAWNGDASGRAVRLRVVSQSGGVVRGDLVFVLGPTERSYSLRGTITPQGVLAMSDGAGMVLNAQVTSSSMRGTTRSGSRAKPVNFTASWSAR